ncbi:MAG: hypothetical protein AAFU59_07120 [Pseudomonadota bacterium]
MLQSPLAHLKADMVQAGFPPGPDDWDRLTPILSARHVQRRAPIYEKCAIADRFILIFSGIAASFYTHVDGRVSLTRFFDYGQLAANVTSTFTRDYGSDELVAITDVTGVEMPRDFALGEYMSGDGFGAYLRQKIVSTIQYDKDLLVCQTLNDTDVRYRFLEQRHPGILDVALKKDIAAFLGVTPQGFSRFLHRRARP